MPEAQPYIMCLVCFTVVLLGRDTDLSHLLAANLLTVLGVCFVAEDPKEREHLRQILSEAAPKLSPIKLRHSDRSQDEGVN
jgi:hypothetical protein